jgi:hypothetical protein
LVFGLLFPEKYVNIIILDNKKELNDKKNLVKKEGETIEEK